MKISDNLIASILEEEDTLKKRLNAIKKFKKAFKGDFENYSQGIEQFDTITDFDYLHKIEVGEYVDYECKYTHKIYNALAKENRATRIPKKFKTKTIDKLKRVVRVTRIF